MACSVAAGWLAGWARFHALMSPKERWRPSATRSRTWAGGGERSPSSGSGLPLHEEHGLDAALVWAIVHMAELAECRTEPASATQPDIRRRSLGVVDIAYEGHVSDVKTDTGRRAIDIDPGTVDLLSKAASRSTTTSCTTARGATARPRRSGSEGLTGDARVPVPTCAGLRGWASVSDDSGRDGRSRG